MAKLTAEQEQFLKDLAEETTRQGNRLGAHWLRVDLQAGNLKIEDLTPEQKQLLIDYPEEETE